MDYTQTDLQVIGAICVKLFNTTCPGCLAEGEGVYAERPFPFLSYIWSVIIQFLYIVDPVSTSTVLDYHVKRHISQQAESSIGNRCFSLPGKRFASQWQRAAAPALLLTQKAS